MSLAVTIRQSFPGFALEASFESAGRLTALFGPSGCGKTTIINVIAGLLRPEVARITLNGSVFADTAGGKWTPPHRRRIGYVFQDARLLPHLSVQQNLRYGQWFTPPAQRYADEGSVIELLGLGGLLQRRPATLSGGERQRVAIGRALLQSPRLLLMDEPLAALDEARKAEILPYIERLRDEVKVPVIYVSHRASEVARLATDVVLMAKGKVVRSGSVQDVLPALALASQDLGMDAGSLLDASVLAYDSANDLTTLRTAAGDLCVAGRLMPASERFRVHIRAADVMLATAKPEHISALNVLEGTIETLTESGPSIDVRIAVGDSAISSRITRFSADRMKLSPGRKVYAVIKTMSLRQPGT